MARCLAAVHLRNDHGGEQRAQDHEEGADAIGYRRIYGIGQGFTALQRQAPALGQGEVAARGGRDLYGWLCDLINLFGQLGGFDLITSAIEKEDLNIR